MRETNDERTTTIRTHQILFRLAAILMILTAVSLWKVSGLYARYVTTDSGGDSARTAAFVVNVGGSETIDLSDITQPGDSKNYTFTVANTDGSAVSEVAESYTITVSLNGSMPVTCTLTESSETDSVLEVDATGTGYASENTGQTASGRAMTFAASVGETDTYTLTVEWPEDYNDVSYAESVSSLTVTVTAEQVD